MKAQRKSTRRKVGKVVARGANVSPKPRKAVEDAERRSVGHVMGREKAVSVPRVAKATTIRLDPSVQEGLDLLHELEGRPMNQVVNTALRSYSERRALEVEADLHAILAKVRAYRKSDPGNVKAWKKFVVAEVAYGADDSAEGAQAVTGPAQSMVQNLLRR